MTKTTKRWALETVAVGAPLVLSETAVPTPARGEVLVRVKAVSLNYRDKLVRETGMGLPLQFPFLPASDMAGVVEAVGDGVTRFSVGDRVISTFHPGWIDDKPLGDARNPPYKTLGGFHPGVLSEYIAIPQDWLVSAPATLDYAEASTLPCAGLTAWFALVERGKIKPGDSVLVQGTGGVALFALQIAAAQGAEVFVTSSGPEKLAKAKALGAHHGIDRNKSNWVEEVYRLTNDRGIDHIIEIAGGPNLGQSLKAVALHGRISVIGVLEGFDISGPAGPLLLKSPVIQGISVGHRRSLEDFVRAVDSIGLKPVIDHRYAFGEVPAAFDHLDRGAFGKIVIEL
ncbi:MULTISPECIES: NAD(P)-dependent alcohol dehydrogenase [unclassified Rhizobium]|uniref:zinc-dependent alcohol dehydrogenase family protein n=1 Tax=unclassified Rhizobium TaxID=2613769 RepID=UPI000EA83E9E|nr:MULTISPECIES: NAD(P)-dependent alcohol dehydrogenase [unclassified Rhizobium]AYG65306.1 NAD(P)-dependent alcohol dehydrogenase [Rhizobium sp. CCGE531]AYG71790.1 NAD(P)-dependent alcohol dehydrogenase [Rhizobium sp. CCGE532]